MKELDSGISLYNEPLGMLMEDSLFTVIKSASKPSTVEKYEGVIRVDILNSPLYQRPIKNIKPLDLQQYYNDLYDKKNKSENVIRTIHKLIKTFFNYAIKENIVLQNPCNNVNLPKDDNLKDAINEDILVFTSQEIFEIQKCTKPITTINIIKTALLTGLRSGEILALTISDVDLNTKEIAVTKTVKKVKIFSNKYDYQYQTIVQKPKTKASIRILPFPDILVATIKNQIIYEKAKHLKLGITYDSKKWINFY